MDRKKNAARATAAYTAWEIAVETMMVVEPVAYGMDADMIMKVPKITRKMAENMINLSL